MTCKSVEATQMISSKKKLDTLNTFQQVSHLTNVKTHLVTTRRQYKIKNGGETHRKARVASGTFWTLKQTEIRHDQESAQ